MTLLCELDCQTSSSHAATSNCTSPPAHQLSGRGHELSWKWKVKCQTPRAYEIWQETKKAAAALGHGCECPGRPRPSSALPWFYARGDREADLDGLVWRDGEGCACKWECDPGRTSEITPHSCIHSYLFLNPKKQIRHFNATQESYG